MSQSDKYKHFIMDEDGNYYVGNHIFIDCKEIDNSFNVAEMIEMLKKACVEAGATVLYHYVHEFGPNCGTTGVIILAESHVTWHHYPEANMIVFDAFMCGKARPTLLISPITNFTKAKLTSVRQYRRGVI